MLLSSAEASQTSEAHYLLLTPFMSKENISVVATHQQNSECVLSKNLNLSTSVVDFRALFITISIMMRIASLL